MKHLRAFLGFILGPFVKGSSVVTREGNSAIKISKPKILVRFIYLIFCQRWYSPYESLRGIHRAAALRSVANHVTSFDPNLGKPIFIEAGVTKVNGKPALKMKWVEGERVSKANSSNFLKLVENALYHAGLPTWSVSLNNPRAHEDVRGTENGLVCLDLESVLPNVFAPNGNRRLDVVNFERLNKTLERARTSGYEDYQEFAGGVTLLRAFSDQRRPKWQKNQAS